MIIDNVGFDQKAMAKMKESDFINTHLSNDAIAKGLSESERKEWLKNAYAKLTGKNKEAETKE